MKMICNPFGEYKFWFSDSLQSRCKFGRWVLSIFLEKTMATIFNFNGSARLGKDRNLCQRGDQWSKIRRGVGWGGENYSPFPAPHPTAASISKSNMTGWVNDCELLTLTCPNRMPALQANFFRWKAFQCLSQHFELDVGKHTKWRK